MTGTINNLEQVRHGTCSGCISTGRLPSPSNSRSQVWLLVFRVPDPFFPYRVPIGEAAIIPSFLYRPEPLKKPRCIRLYVHPAAVHGRFPCNLRRPRCIKRARLP
jgi:hypothetical protein